MPTLTTEAVRIKQGNKSLASEKTLDSIKNILSNSAITQKGENSFESSLASLKKSTVTFNEKTMRWHDKQTKLMVKGSDPRVLAATLKPEPSAVKKAVDDGMITNKKMGLGVPVGFLKEIAQNTKEILAKTGQNISMTAEDEVESQAWQENRDEDMKKRGKTLRGMWETLKEQGKKSWLAQNWKLILAGLAFLFAPLEWIKKLWSLTKAFWELPMWGKISAGIAAIALYFGGTAFLTAIGGALATAIGGMFSGGAAATAAASFIGPTAAAGTAAAGIGASAILPIVLTLLAAVAVGTALNKWVVDPFMKKYYDKQDQKANEKFKKDVENQEKIRSLGVKSTVIKEGSLAWLMNQDMQDKGDKKGLTIEQIKKKYVKELEGIARTADPKGGWSDEYRDFKDKHSDKMDYKEFIQSDLYKSSMRDESGAVSGESSKRKEAKHASYVKTGKFAQGKTAPTATPIPTPTPASPTTPKKSRYVGVPSKKQPGGDDKHKAVKVSQADMSGVSWNKLGGRDTIEDAILTTWNQAGVSATPTFTSGYRGPDHKQSKSNPQSQHIQKTAFDLRSNDLGSKASEIWGNLKSTMAGLGLWGQWEEGDKNKKNRTGEHFHFQLASRGFEGIVGKDGPRGFIAGESGEELVRIQPLVSPDDKMNAMNTLNAKNKTLQGQSSSSPIIIGGSTTNTSSSKAGDLNTFSQRQAHSNKTLKTSMV